MDRTIMEPMSHGCAKAWVIILKTTEDIFHEYIF